MPGRDKRTPEKRASDCHAWYLLNKESVKTKSATYRAMVKASPVAWAAFIEKARLYKRRVHGWKRTYRARIKQSIGGQII